MRITLTNEKKSIDIEVKETAVCIQVTAIGDQMFINVEEQPMMMLDEPGWTRTEMTCKWKQHGKEAFCQHEDIGDLQPFRLLESLKHAPFCQVCSKKIEVVQ